MYYTRCKVHTYCFYGRESRQEHLYCPNEVLKTLTLQAPVLTRQFDAAITVLLQNYTVMDNSSGFIRSRLPAKIAAYLVRICLLPLPTLSVFSLRVMKKLMSLPPNLVSSDSYSKTF